MQRIQQESRLRLSSSPVAIGQGAFYLITGIWPLLDVSSFQRVTGPKFDLWLVKTVGVLLSVIGLVLALAGIRRQVRAEVKLLAVGSAVGFTGIDSIYVAKRRISPIYLVDALVEICLVLLWSFVRTSRDIAEEDEDG